jgi:hypothetical protein
MMARLTPRRAELLGFAWRRVGESDLHLEAGQRLPILNLDARRFRARLKKSELLGRSTTATFEIC